MSRTGMSGGNGRGLSRARSATAICLECAGQGRDLARGAVLRDRARELRVLRVDGVCRPRVLDEAGFLDVAGFAADAAARGMDLTAIPRLTTSATAVISVSMARESTTLYPRGMPTRVL